MSKKILICTRKNKGAQEVELELEAERLYRAVSAQRGDPALVVRDEALPWKDLKAIHGSFNGAADAAGQRYDTVVLVEVEIAGTRTIGKGQYRIANAAMSAGNQVVTARPGKTGEFNVVLTRVLRLVVDDPDDWQASFGRAEP
jgi:hypothetical protein